ncbi:MAG TPA: hypothetical protein VKL61_01810 [Candidatus Polarisedimenticolia bacterium]|nr:hypothetical protein [Candidatus Polarisedimenticolia bacterium]
MPKFQVRDFRSLEEAPSSPGTLRTKVDDLLIHSTLARVKVENLNRETGEYRVVLQGTLEKQRGESV